MTYASEIETNTNFKTNIVVDIDGSKFSKYQVDSGLTIDADKVGMVDSASINPTQVDLKKSLTTTYNTSVKLIDKGETFSIALFIGSDDGALIGKTLKIWLGRSTGSFPWSDYLLVNEYIIKSISKSRSIYTIKAKSNIDKGLTPGFLFLGNSKNAITGLPSTIDITIQEDIPVGFEYVKVGDEFIQFTGSSFDGVNKITLSGLTRGALGSDSADHEEEVEASFVYEVQENPIDILLKTLISNGGGGVWDVYPDGMGIDESLIDITSFTDIRDTNFSSVTFRLFLYDIKKLLEFVQAETLQPINCRLAEKADTNKISLVLLDQFNFLTDPFTLDEDITLPDPKWSLTENGVANHLTILWDYREGDSTYRKTTVFTNSDSINKYDTKREVIKFQGVKSALGGNSIIQQFANRFIGRFSTPLAEIQCGAFMKAGLVSVGDKVNFISRHVPQQGAGLGMEGIVEVKTRGVNFKTGTINFGLVFTSYTNDRVGLISPAIILENTIHSQKSFDTPTDYGKFYGVGFKCRLWSLSGNIYLPDAINTITDVTGDTLTFENDFTTTLTSDIILKFADYNNVSDAQKLRYAFVGFGSADYNSDYNTDYLTTSDGTFADGGQAYSITL